MRPIRTIARNRDGSINFDYYRNHAADLRAQTLREIAKDLKPSPRAMLVAITTIIAVLTVTWTVAQSV